MFRKDSKEFEVPICALGIQRALEKSRSTLVCDYVDDELDRMEEGTWVPLHERNVPRWKSCYRQVGKPWTKPTLSRGTQSRRCS